MRCKVRLEEITQTPNGYKLKYFPVNDGTEEDKLFFKWTPSGVVELAIVNEAVVKDLVPGKKYYLDFTPVPEGV